MKYGDVEGSDESLVLVLKYESSDSRIENGAACKATLY